MLKSAPRKFARKYNWSDKLAKIPNMKVLAEHKNGTIYQKGV